jgi:hypothetical protein
MTASRTAIQAISRTPKCGSAAKRRTASNCAGSGKPDSVTHCAAQQRATSLACVAKR